VGKNSSWKTTLSGIFAALAIALEDLGFLLDGDPSTVCEWSNVTGAAFIILLAILARDDDRSSEDVGAK
jgi:hypothetical protein